MSVTSWVPTVTRINDGDIIDQALLNTPIDQLTQRDQHLYDKFAQLANKSVLVVTDQPIHPKASFTSGELALAYYRSDSFGQGLDKGITGFSSSATSSMFTPNVSNYSFGMVKAVNALKNTADLFIEGLCELDVPLNDSTLGLIQKDANGVVETFAVGPYYLSSKSPGKITNNPSGIPVYVGYAISTTKFILHTNVDEFSQFFINYRYHVLDRVAGTPVFTPTSTVTFTGSISAVTTSNTVSVLTLNTAASGGTLAIGSTITGTNVQANTTILALISGTLGATGSTYSLSVPHRTAVTLQSITATSASGTWTITNTNTNALGWVPATGTFPAGAMFRYNIPSAAIMLSSDNFTTTEEQQEAAELSKNLPPLPANFNQLYSNGTLLRYYDVYDTAGRYSIDSYGIWWYSNKANEVPWSQSYPTTNNEPSKWVSIKTALGTTSRNNLFLSFSKFNPALRTQLVSSLSPLTTSVSNFIKFYSKDNPSQQAVTGDLLIDIDAPVTQVGFSATTLQALTEYPTTSSATYTAGRAVAALAYSKTDGAFKAVVTPVVSKLLGTKGISVADQGHGVWQVSYLSEGAVGLVDSIEPVNARLEFRGLSSYIKLPPTYTTSYGFIGKIVLPQGYFTGKDLNIVFHLFGSSNVVSGGNGNVSFSFEYSTVSAANGAFPVAANTLVGSTATVPVTTTFSMVSSGAYTPYTSIKVAPSLTIPGSVVSEDSIVNFKITRVAPSSSPYAGDIGVLATYWNIPSAST
jgi:hypothetical protein